MGMGIHFIFLLSLEGQKNEKKIQKKSLRSICNIVILYAYAKMTGEREKVHLYNMHMWNDMRNLLSFYMMTMTVCDHYDHDDVHVLALG